MGRTEYDVFGRWVQRAGRQQRRSLSDRGQYSAVVDNVSWTKGKHTFRFGFEYNRQNFNQVGNQFSRGQFTFQPTPPEFT